MIDHGLTHKFNWFLCHGNAHVQPTVMTESDTDQMHHVELDGRRNDNCDSSSLGLGEMGLIVPRRNHPYRRRSAESNAISSVYEDVQSVDSYGNDLSQLAPMATQRSRQMEICDEQDGGNRALVTADSRSKNDSTEFRTSQTVIQTMNTTYNQVSDAEKAARDLQMSTEQRLNQADAQIAGTISAIHNTTENRMNGIESQITATQQHQQAMMSQIESKLSGAVEEMQGINESRMKQTESHLSSMNNQCQALQTAVNTLVGSLKAAMERLDSEHNKHESLIQQSNNTVARVIEQSQVVWDRNRILEENETNRLTMQTSQSETPTQIQQEMSRLREKNRDRAGITPDPPPSRLEPSEKQRDKEEAQTHQHASSPSALFTDPNLPGKMTLPNAWVESAHRHSSPTIPIHQKQTIGPVLLPVNQSDNNVKDPGKITSDSHGYNLLPYFFYPNMMVDSCPPFTPATFQNWKREVKLRIAGQPGATVTQILAKLIHILPLSVKTDALLYMESTEGQVESRSVDKIMQLLDRRFGRTDSERACSWLTAFTEFKRENGENYKDF